MINSSGWTSIIQTSQNVYLYRKDKSKADTILQYCNDHNINLQDVVFVDDVIPLLQEAERKGITSFHISSFL